jgi:hypothetical protein
MHQLPRGLMPGNRASGYRNFSATQFPTNGLLGNLALPCVDNPHIIRIMLHRTEPARLPLTVILGN